MSHFSLAVFGPPRAVRDGRPLPLTRRKGLALLIYLTVTRQRHSRDALAAMFWPDQDQAAARGNLRRELFRLKEICGREMLTIERETVCLCHEVDMETDLDRFHNLLAACRAHEHERPAGCSACRARLEEVVALYADDFLAGFSLTDAPEFDEWQFYLQETLRQELTTALGWLIDACTARQAYDEAITYARRWLALDPLHEPVVRQLMRLYAWSGRRSTALREFRLLERRLAQEVDLRPAPETTILCEAIRTRRFTRLPDGFEGAAHPQPAGSPSVRRPPLGECPPRPASSFIGREKELAAAVELLAHPRRRLLTVVGPAGSGRSRLLSEAAAAAGDRFPDGIVYLPLAGIDLQRCTGTINPLIDRIAHALDYPLHGGADPLTQLFGYLRPQRMLLILDDLDFLLTGYRFPETVDIVPALLQQAAGLQILVAARRRLRVEEEWVLLLRGLDGPASRREAGRPASPAPWPAVRLFDERAGRVRPAYDVAAARPAALRLCRLVRGLPLGIELAAGWPAGRSYDELAGTLARTMRESPSLGRPRRPLPLLLDLIRETFSPSERRALRCLAEFNGRFSRTEALARTGVTPSTLVSLTRRYLVTPLPDDSCLLHDEIRRAVADDTVQ